MKALHKVVLLVGVFTAGFWAGSYRERVKGRATNEAASEPSRDHRELAGRTESDNVAFRDVPHEASRDSEVTTADESDHQGSGMPEIPEMVEWPLNQPIPTVRQSISSRPPTGGGSNSAARTQSEERNLPTGGNQAATRVSPTMAGQVELVAAVDGRRMRLSDIVGTGRGLLHIVTLPCAPCVREWPEMVASFPRLDAQGIIPVVIGLVPTADAERFRDYLKQLLPADADMPTIWLTPDRALLKTLRLGATAPQTVLLNLQFEPAAQWVGPMGDLWRNPETILRSSGIHDMTGKER